MVPAAIPMGLLPFSSQRDYTSLLCVRWRRHINTVLERGFEPMLAQDRLEDLARLYRSVCM